MHLRFDFITTGDRLSSEPPSRVREDGGQVTRPDYRTP
jgi:hypothetical protein